MPRLTDDACKGIIRKISVQYSIDSKLIVTRLMNQNDKEDMRNGDLSMDVLDLYVSVWIKSGCPDYAHGLTEPYADNQELLIKR